MGGVEPSECRLDPATHRNRYAVEAIRELWEALRGSQNERDCPGPDGPHDIAPDIERTP